MLRALLLAIALTTPSFAQDPDTTVFSVGEIVVQATRPAATTGGAAAIEVRVDSLRLKAAPTLEQLMRTMPLVQVRTNSRGEAQFSLRGSGSDSRQVAVVVDGVPLSLGWDHRADLSVVPVTAAHTFTLARGLPSLLYGPNVLGGVVEIGVARGTTAQLNPRGVRVDAGIDEGGGYGIAGAVTLPRRTENGNLLIRAGGGHRGRDGFPLAGIDTLRLNTHLRHSDAFGALRYEARTGSWGALTASGYKAERGIPAELDIRNPRYWRYPRVSRGLFVVSGGSGVRASPFGGSGDLEVSVGLDAGTAEIDQYTSATYSTIDTREKGDDRNVTVRARADQTLGKRAQLRSALTYADINHDEVLTPGAPASVRQRLWSLGSEVSIRALRAGRVSIGAAYDGADTPESGDKPSLGTLHEWGARAGFTSAVNERVFVHGGASRRARFPALRELYSGALGRFEPNPDLRAEILVAAEAGATLQFSRVDIQTVLFRHALSDAIVRISTPDRRFKRVNRDRQTGTGIELMVASSIGRMNIGADVTLQTTTLADGSGAESQPEYQPDVVAGLNVTVLLPFELRVDTRARYTGRQYCVNPDSGARDAIDAAKLYSGEIGRSFAVRRGWLSRLEVAGGVDNLTDATVYDQCGLPQSGRSFRLQVRLR